ncbi:MAG TPA: hypothetical protein VLT82_02395 [Myxococcaceae bacterium]|nr:hypothetical protein [Myxococcaceae bacterium]
MLPESLVPVPVPVEPLPPVASPEPYEEPDPAVPVEPVPADPEPPYIGAEPVVRPDPVPGVSEPVEVEPVLPVVEPVDPVLPEDWARANGAAPSIPRRTIFFMNPLIVCLSRWTAQGLRPGRPRFHRGLGWMPRVTTDPRDNRSGAARAAGEQPVGPPRIPGSRAE